jgi:ketosteroid isomerase-like protein
MMASPNVELFETGVDAYNRRDPEAFVTDCEPDCEWHPFLSSQVEGATGYRGRDGIRAWFPDIDSMFSEMRAAHGEWARGHRDRS